MTRRILTTHAGSLPRPRRLVQLYAHRVNGEAIDEGVLAAEGEAATRAVVARQREAGIDIPSDGEQVREGFFLYVQRRMRSEAHTSELQSRMRPSYAVFCLKKKTTNTPITTVQPPNLSSLMRKA